MASILFLVEIISASVMGTTEPIWKAVSLEPIVGFLPDLHRYIIGRRKKLIRVY